MNMIWEFFVRWRTWIVNLVLAASLVLPELLNSPEILAVIPEGWQRWVAVAAFLINIWMRPRAAAMAHDPEVQIKKAIDNSDPIEHA